MRNSKRVLVVDDEQGMRELLEIVLGGEGYDIVCASSPEEAQPLLERQTFNAVVTDLRIGSDAEAGMRFLSWLRESVPSIPTIMFCTNASGSKSSSSILG